MNRVDNEKKVVKLMIEVYCKKNHSGNAICSECKALLDYAFLRADRCPFKENKTFCSNCTVHCYKPEMKEKIRNVMRFSGPRMILYHPIIAIKHVISTKRKGKKST